MVNQPTTTQINQEFRNKAPLWKVKNIKNRFLQKKNLKPAVLSFHGRDHGDGKVHNLYIKTLKLEQLVEMLKDKFCLSSKVSTEFHRYDLNFIAVAETDLNSAYDIEI